MSKINQALSTSSRMKKDPVDEHRRSFFSNIPIRSSSATLLTVHNSKPFIMMMRLFQLAIIATVVQVGFSQSGDEIPGMGGMPGMGGAPCPKFRCSGGYVPVQKSRAKFVSKGCSSMGGGMMMMTGGGGSGGEKYDSCCDQWHACYQTCGVSKELCDEAFKSCSAGMCAGDDQCKKDADLKVMMLGFGGCQSFDQGQYAACECAPKDKVEEKRSAALRAFYKKYAPDSIDKAAGLAKKADTTAKMAGVIRKLLAKYPSAIKKEVDTEQNKYAKMMQDARDGKLPSDEELGDMEGDSGTTEEL